MSGYEVIGPFHLRRRLGIGATSEVYEARHRGAAGFERPVCVKRILSSIKDEQRFRETFYREVQFAGQLHHANIVQVFDCIEDDYTVGLVMELVDGMDVKVLTDLASEQDCRIPEGIVAYIAGHVLMGLAYAHEKGVIHRDMSPHNILVSFEGEVKIADFGIATVLSSASGGSDSIPGKLAYMSPEQARGKGLDPRTDLYSVGLILYELLTGERFFPHASRWQLIHTVAHARQPSLTVGHPKLRKLIEGLLEPLVDCRIPTAEKAMSLLPPWAAIGPRGAFELAGLIKSLRRNERPSKEPPW